MGFFRKHKQQVAIVLLPVLVVLYVNSVINRHEHLVSGNVYTHSHPFDRSAGDSPYQPHHHTDRELLFLDQISIPVMVLIAALVLAAPDAGLFEYIPGFVRSPLRKTPDLLSDPRAPPPLHII
ncbi:MAG: hypothetical protein R2744_12960 [Bacteroidales bacterium]